MAVLKTAISQQSQDFQQNIELMEAQVKSLTELVDNIKQGGGQKAQTRQNHDCVRCGSIAQLARYQRP